MASEILHQPGDDPAEDGDGVWPPPQLPDENLDLRRIGLLDAVLAFAGLLFAAGVALAAVAYTASLALR